jgi:hypothetical protein
MMALFLRKPIKGSFKKISKNVRFSESQSQAIKEKKEEAAATLE